MGYYTTYTLNADATGRDPSTGVLQIMSGVEMIPGLLEKLDDAFNELDIYGIDGTFRYGIGGYSKWYDHDDDMLELSRQFPTVLFTLYGEGESSDDIWVSYYYNGRSQYSKARIEYDDFSEDKLSDPQYGGVV